MVKIICENLYIQHFATAFGATNMSLFVVASELKMLALQAEICKWVNHEVGDTNA